MSVSSELLQATIEAVQGEFDDKANELKDLMKTEAHKISGNLASSMVANKESDTRYIVGVDSETLANKSENGVDYSMYYWKGRGEVRPKTKEALRFKVNGKYVFAKKSKAWGGDPFVERAISKFK